MTLPILAPGSPRPFSWTTLHWVWVACLFPSSLEHCFCLQIHIWPPGPWTWSCGLLTYWPLMNPPCSPHPHPVLLQHIPPPPLPCCLSNSCTSLVKSPDPLGQALVQIKALCMFISLTLFLSPEQWGFEEISAPKWMWEQNQMAQHRTVLADGIINPAGF